MTRPNGDFNMRKTKSIVTPIAYYKAKAARAERELRELRQENEARDAKLEALVNDFSERFDGGKLYMGFGVHNLYTVLNSICYEYGRGQLNYPGTTDGSKPTGFVWTRTITLTDDEIRVLRMVRSNYGMSLKGWHNGSDGAIASHLVREYKLLKSWASPYTGNANRFGLSDAGQELFDNKAFHAYLKALDEKQAAVEPETSNAE